jgi:hypothetical protein
MSDRIWLDSYTGQSVDELLALESTHRIDSLVVAFEQALYQKISREGDDSIGDEESVVLAVEALEREVNNGGYSQFVVNAFEFLPIIVDALRRIDCVATAEITQSALDALQAYELQPGTDDSEMLDDPVLVEKLAQCDEAYFQCPDNIEYKLFSFVRANKAAIRLK